MYDENSFFSSGVIVKMFLRTGDDSEEVLRSEGRLMKYYYLKYSNKCVTVNI